MSEFKPDAEMFVCMDPTGCYHVSWNLEQHRAKMAQVGARHEARYLRAIEPQQEEAVAEHSPDLADALRSLKSKLEAMPEELRGPFLVKGLAPYAHPTPAQKVQESQTVSEPERVPHEVALAGFYEAQRDAVKALPLYDQCCAIYKAMRSAALEQTP